MNEKEDGRGGEYRELSVISLQLFCRSKAVVKSCVYVCVCVCMVGPLFQNFLSPSRTCSINPPLSCLCCLSQPLFYFLPTHRGRFVCPKKTHQKTSPLFLQLHCSSRLLCALTPEFVAKPSPSPHSIRSPCKVPCPPLTPVLHAGWWLLKGSDGLGHHQV